MAEVVKQLSTVLQDIRARNIPALPPEKKPNPADLIEADVADLAAKEYAPKPRERMMKNSRELIEARELLKTAITDAHADTCRAVDRRMEEVMSLVAKLKKAADDYKTKSNRDCQEVVYSMESSMQVLARDMEWFEKTEPSTRNPQLTKQEPAQE